DNRYILSGHVGSEPKSVLYFVRVPQMVHMRMLRSLIPIPFLLVSLFTRAQSTVPANERWQCQLTSGTDFGPVDTYLDIEWSDAAHFTAKSPKTADKRVFGTTKSMLARMMKKLPKKGRLLAVTDGR